ncbi:MAG: pilT 5 [Gammaproteobacteria bacterium]|jgi:twitching motility protein PilT|nr:pilT 5 [Gammaproteobacteria bacterium]
MEIHSLLSLSVAQYASDLHLSPGMPPCLRIDGELAVMPDFPILDARMTKNLIFSVMAPEQQQQFEKEFEIDFAIQIPNIAGFRINVFREKKGIAAVFRVIPSQAPTFEQLDMPIIFKELMELSHGLILVTGASGSGKSTSLAAMVDHINTHQASHIITIEDPIEFVHVSKKSLINQRQIHRDTHTFSNALRSALREDPDVILVGELRDLETMRLALTAAETGHLVMATLHASSAARAVNRIVDVFPAGEKNNIRYLLAESLRAVIYQTLIKSLPSGRVAAFEIMLNTPAIRHLIREDKIAQMNAVIQTGRDKGMCTMAQYLQELVAKKKIDLVKVSEEMLS